jgi:hypothetical protein
MSDIPAGNFTTDIAREGSSMPAHTKIGIALTLFRNVDNSSRHEFVSLIGPVGNSRGEKQRQEKGGWVREARPDQAKKNPARRGHPRRGFLHAFGHDGGRALCAEVVQF